MWKAEHNRSDWSGLGRFWGQPLLSARPLWHSSTSQKEGLLDKRFSNWWPFKISVLDLNENSVRGHFVFRLEIVGSSNLLFPPILSSPLPFDEPRKLEPGFSKFEDKNTALIKSLDLIYFWPNSLFAPGYRGEYAIWKSYQTGLGGFHHCKGISSFERETSGHFLGWGSCDLWPTSV